MNEQFFFHKGPKSEYFGFVAYMISVLTVTQPCLCSMKTAINDR